MQCQYVDLQLWQFVMAYKWEKNKEKRWIETEKNFRRGFGWRRAKGYDAGLPLIECDLRSKFERSILEYDFCLYGFDTDYRTPVILWGVINNGSPTNGQPKEKC